LATQCFCWLGYRVSSASLGLCGGNSTPVSL
jgi:hypothetical protein